MAISVTPTLSSTSGYLTDVRDQVMYLLRFLIMNPGGTSDMWENHMISLRLLSSELEHNKNELCSALEKKILNILENKFADYSFDVLIQPKEYEETSDSRYTISFSISIKAPGMNDFESAFIIGDISVDKTNNNIDLKFSNSNDTSTLG